MSFLHHSFLSKYRPITRLSYLVHTLVVAGKFDAIQLGLLATTAPEDQTNVSTIWSQNEEDQISVLVRVNDLAKSALQTGQPRLVQNANELPLIK